MKGIKEGVAVLLGNFNDFGLADWYKTFGFPPVFHDFVIFCVACIQSETKFCLFSESQRYIAIYHAGCLDSYRCNINKVQK